MGGHAGAGSQEAEDPRPVPAPWCWGLQYSANAPEPWRIRLGRSARQPADREVDISVQAQCCGGAAVHRAATCWRRHGGGGAVPPPSARAQGCPAGTCGSPAWRASTTAHGQPIVTTWQPTSLTLGGGLRVEERRWIRGGTAAECGSEYYTRGMR